MTPSPLDQSDSESPGAEAHLPEPLPGDPFPLFKRWFDEAAARRAQPNPNSFTLATMDADGRVSGRIILCKGIDVVAGHIVFYTNYQGRKGRALDCNPRGAAVFHWDALDRQVRMEGPVTRSPDSESDAYFESRPWISRVGAWASNQSEPIAGREALRAQLEATMRRFGIDPARPPASDARVSIPRPPHWGGYRLWAERVELWMSGAGRLHDRAAWMRTLRASRDAGCETYSPSSAWSCTRLQP